MADEDKTEDATPHKLEEARRQGDVPHSRELTAFLVFLGFSLTMYFSGSLILKRLAQVFKDAFGLKLQLVDTAPEFILLSQGIIAEIFWMIGPLFAVVAVFAIGSSVGQFGFLFTLEKIMPKFDRMNPTQGVTKMFSRETVMELVKSILKVALFGLILFFVVRGELATLEQLGMLPMIDIFHFFLKIMGELIMVALIFMASIGLMDFAYQRWSYAMKMKMSMKEIRDEQKQREGDPHIKSRVRQIQRERARKRMMDEVPKADVVVTNPTHVAVALKYDRGKMRAPVVVAKGAGYIAVKIKEIAVQAQVPIVEKKALARYLYRHTEVGDVVPESLYDVVAEVLAFVYRMKRKYRNWLKGQTQPAVMT